MIFKWFNRKKRQRFTDRIVAWWRKIPLIIHYRSLLKVTTVSFLMTAIIIAGFYYYISKQALPAASIRQASHIVDMHGNVIDTLHQGEIRYSVPLSSISPYVIHATLAIEDRRFYDHFGFDMKGLARAAVVNVQHMSAKQGASTLTQQLARNLYLTHEKTWQRKLKEAFYTTQLEMKYSKDEILAMYLNQIYYGHGSYGIEAAAQFYFSKKADQLNLAESTLLAGIPKGPKYYSPYNNMKAAKDRQRTILQAMVEQGTITEMEANQAHQEVLQFAPAHSQAQTNNAQYFSDYVQSILTEQLGISEQLINEGGIIVHTTLDSAMQAAAEESIQQKMPEQSEQQAALIAIDPRNGYIKAMVGGRNYASNQFNRVLTDTRQPGSTFKPFVYLAALKNRTMSPTTHFKSEPTVFTYDDDRKTYEPRNYGNKYVMDNINLRKAIASSDNIYAVHALMLVGAEEVIATAQQLGVQSPLQPMPSLALGTYPVSPLEMAAAFGVFAAAGEYNKPMAILRVEDRYGNIIFEAKRQTEQVISPAEAYVMTNLLESVFQPGGTGHRVASTIKRPVAGKTGTTATDAWMVGYTPELTTAVWVGYDKDRKLTVAEAQRAAPIFATFTEQALAAIPPKVFPIAETGITGVYIDTVTGQRATENCPHKQLEFFLNGTEPAESDICEHHSTNGLQETNDDGNMTDQQTKDQKRTWWEDFRRWWSN
ncbi:transglycosylase domain-containing protein [Paenibacillus yanchengensis]|uniref:Transglycosylase domain-containing protein n=1 Tax=Paenibacillus yanchengensis TaxID=2035833 RepID=A0ABW4YPQ9_9BACL